MIIAAFFERHAKELKLKLIVGRKDVDRVVSAHALERPGLCLTGYLKGFDKKRILVFGRVELSYLKTLDAKKRVAILKKIISSQTPIVIVAERCSPLQEIIQVCVSHAVPVVASSLSTVPLMQHLFTILEDELSPTLSCHASFVEIFGIGVLIQGEASIGKSEAALGLIKRGHRLVSDDIVKLKLCQRRYLEGHGFDTSRHHLEVKGIGIINVARLYGTVAVREKKSLDIVVKLEVWDDNQLYVQNRHKDKTINLLGMKVPFHLLPVKPGRDVVLLLETIALNHRLKILSELENKGKL